MKLPIPIICDDGVTITEIEYIKPNSGVIEKASETARKGNVFSAIADILTECTTEMTKADGGVISEKSEIKARISLMPYQSGFTANIAIMGSVIEEDDDFIMGVYECPVCRKTYKDLVDPDMGIDTRARVSELDINYMPDNAITNKIVRSMEEPLILARKKSGEVYMEVSELAMRYPTLKDCSAASLKNAGKNDSGLDKLIYAEAITEVNGEKASQEWVNVWAPLAISKLSVKDKRYIKKELAKYGTSSTAKKTCRNRECGHTWDQVVDTSGFFASAFLV